MLRRKVRLKITASSRQAISHAGERLSAYCVACGREVEMVTAAGAAAILQVNERELARLASEGLIHTVETVNWSLWVCKGSLFRSEEKFL